MAQKFDAYSLEFIGRQEEIHLFEEWIKNVEQQSLLFFHDSETEQEKQGGIGKTFLLRKLFDLTQKHHPNFIPVMIDFFTIEARNGVFIANNIIRAVQRRYRTWTPSAFNEMLNDYYHAIASSSKNITDIREQMGYALASDLEALQPRMEKDNSYILLYFDTFESIQDNPKTVLLSSPPRFPDYYHSERIRSVMAGRNAPIQPSVDWQWQENIIHLHPLSAFNFKEIEQYIQITVPRIDFSQQSSRSLTAIQTLTAGRPILLALVTEILNRQEVTIDELMREPRSSFEEKLALQILNFTFPLNWSLLFMAHIYHRFNEAILRDVFKEVYIRVGRPLTHADYKRIVSDLVSFPFVRTSSLGNDFVLHDEMRRLIRQYCWSSNDPQKSLRIQISRIAIQHYNALLTEEKNEEIRESYLVEMLYHKLFINVDEGLAFFYQHFDKATTLSQTVFAHNLLEEVKKFDREANFSSIFKKRQLSSEQLEALKFAEAELLLEDDNPKAALRLYEELEDNKHWTEHRASDILYGKANSYFKAEMYPEAVKTYEECLHLLEISNTRTSDIYNSLGLIARRRADYPLAVDYYQKCLAFLKVPFVPQRYASTLNNLGNAYRLLGSAEKGLLFCRRALQFREELLQEGKLGQLPVGLSHSTLALMYHSIGRLAEEETHCEKAFQIFDSLGAKVYLAGAWIARGRLWIRKNNQEQALLCFEEANRLSRGANKEVEIESLNQLGRIYRSQEQWQKAADFFTQALALSREVGQRLNIAENLIFLADVLDRLGQSVEKELEEAKQLAPNKFTEVQVEETRGDIFYRRENYLQAFMYYAMACSLATQYSRATFTSTLEKLENGLLNSPRILLPLIVDSLLKYWTQEGLNETYPEFPELCKNILEL